MTERAADRIIAGLEDAVRVAGCAHAQAERTEGLYGYTLMCPGCESHIYRWYKHPLTEEIQSNGE